MYENTGTAVQSQKVVTNGLLLVYFGFPGQYYWWSSNASLADFCENIFSEYTEPNRPHREFLEC